MATGLVLSLIKAPADRIECGMSHPFRRDMNSSGVELVHHNHRDLNFHSKGIQEGINRKIFADGLILRLPLSSLWVSLRET